MNTPTDIIISALRILVNDIQSPDGVPNACVAQAADRLEELQQKCNIHYETICDLTKERNEARAEVERVKKQIEDETAYSVTIQSQMEKIKRSLRDSIETRNKNFEKLNEARAEVERLKKQLGERTEMVHADELSTQMLKLISDMNAANAPQVRPEPSRLEIAAMIYAGIEHIDDDDALKAADKLIAAAARGGEMRFNLKELREAALPLMEWLAENCHPHCTIIVDSEHIELVEGLATVRRQKKDKEDDK